MAFAQAARRCGAAAARCAARPTAAAAVGAPAHAPAFSGRFAQYQRHQQQRGFVSDAMTAARRGVIDGLKRVVSVLPEGMLPSELGVAHMAALSLLGVGCGMYVGGALSDFMFERYGWKERMSEYERFVDAERALSPEEWRPFALKSKEQLTHDSYRLTFAFPNEEAVSGLTTASCLVARAPDGKPGRDGKQRYAIRPYTPTSTHTKYGELELVVKTYKDGKVSKYLCDMSVGNTIDLKGPIQKYKYKSGTKDHITMIAGGTGITPMWQMMEHMVKNPVDKTVVNLVYCNKTVDDILMREEIDALQARRPHMIIDVHYVLDKAPEGWEGGEGYLTKDMLSAKLPAPGDNHLVMVCGPPPMVASVAGPKGPKGSQGEFGGILKELGWDVSNVYKF